MEGKKVLLIDDDPQASLTISLGHPQPDTLPVTLSDVMGKILMEQPIQPGEGILHHAEGVDLMPTNIQLSGMEVSLVNAMSRETILRQYLDTLRNQYTHIQFDNGTSLHIGNYDTLQAVTDRVQNESVTRAFLRYNPEIVAATKEAALAALRKREVEDNMIAAQKGLKPYTLAG